MTPPASRHTEIHDDDTDSNSGVSGTVTEVREWRGLDKNRRPAIFVEECTTHRMNRIIEQDNHHDRDFRMMSDRMAAGAWRDV